MVGSGNALEGMSDCAIRKCSCRTGTAGLVIGSGVVDIQSHRGLLKGGLVQPVSAMNAREVSSDALNAMPNKCCCCRTAYVPIQSDPLKTRSILNTTASCETKFIKE